MFKRLSVNYSILTMVLDFLGTMSALALTRLLSVSWLDLVWPEQWVAEQGSFIAMTQWPLVGLLWLLVFVLTSVYDPKRNYKAVDEFQHVVMAAGFASLALAGLLYLTNRELSRWLFALFLLIDWTLLLGWRVAARLIFRLSRTAHPAQRRVLIVGAGEVGCRVGATVQEHAWAGLVLEGYLDDDERKQGNDLPVLGTLDVAEQIIRARGIDEVVVALPTRAWQRVNELVATLHTVPVHVHVIPDYFAMTLWRAGVEDFAGIPMIDLRAPALDDYQRLLKRIFDLVVGAAASVCALPFMVAVAVAIKRGSPGPVHYHQDRVGENGRIFKMHKFRTMIVDADKLAPQMVETSSDGTVTYKRKNDPRVTRVGRFLRRYSLDELPQLYNVLKGEMSLIGPRPELPWLVDMYEPWQRKRFAVPQGMTGWWQVNGRSDKEMHLHTEDDLYYVQHYSLWLDLLILVRTALVVVRGRGAY
jgi:exopolysaccharide biosynthesis polyprenyl glycosylphosphotransferase